CTYCIIPYARGRIESRDEAEILTEIRQYVERGYHEFVLTGIHLSSFGMDKRGISNVPDGEYFDGSDLLALLQKVDAIPGVERIRLGSLEPRIITEDFAKGLAALKSFCPHFHLSLQSGSDATLKRMNRHYTTAQFRESVQILRDVFDNPAITTDVITGFPGETEEEFAETRAFTEEINFYEMHVFPYSRREGTPAAAWKEQLTNAQKKERSDVLLQMTAAQASAYRKAWEGKTVDVLMEEECIIDGTRYQSGLTREYIRCAIKTDTDLQGEILTGRIGGALTEEIRLLERD
nr:MiaB/RimO family radical SAM methylthiotransferase [Lachnospiraceae bacterium]